MGSFSMGFIPQPNLLWSE